MAVDVPNNPELADLIRGLAGRMGLDPVDVGTAFSYETKGTLDPQIRGPVTKWGQHIGLMQMGEAQRKRYGITPDSPLPDQFTAFERYLRDAGVKPGHGLLDIYSAINAGRVGRYGRSDAAAGGAPGTVADKVAGMAPHRVRASLLLEGKLPASVGASRLAPQQSVASTAPAPFGLAPEGVDTTEDAGFAALVEAARRAAQSVEKEEPLPSALPPLRILDGMMGGRRARRMA